MYVLLYSNLRAVLDEKDFFRQWLRGLGGGGGERGFKSDLDRHKVQPDWGLNT